MELTSLPEWLATALTAAALATLGFVGKEIFEWVAAIRSRRRVRRARLVTLLSLLNGTRAVYRVQAKLRNRLFEQLTGRNPEWSKQEQGYEALFEAAFSTMSEAERQLHSVIRSYTANGMKPLNEAMLEWLRNDTDFKIAGSGRAKVVDLARSLAALEGHLLMWLAQYATWIPDTPAHALVYLGDEKDLGVPFPTGIEKTIGQALGIRN